MQPIVFELKGEYIELCNLLKIVGIADSGGHGKMMVAEGLAKVDGQLELRKTAKIKAGQQVEIGEQIIQVTQGERRKTSLEPPKAKQKTQKLTSQSPFHLKSPKQKPARKR